MGQADNIKFGYTLVGIMTSPLSKKQSSLGKGEYKLFRFIRYNQQKLGCFLHVSVQLRVPPVDVIVVWPCFGVKHTQMYVE